MSYRFSAMLHIPGDVRDAITFYERAFGATKGWSTPPAEDMVAQLLVHGAEGCVANSFQKAVRARRKTLKHPKTGLSSKIIFGQLCFRTAICNTTGQGGQLAVSVGECLR
jgi:uncharacterized glyoxalase superfamily protein PhnB